MAENNGNYEPPKRADYFSKRRLKQKNAAMAKKKELQRFPVGQWVRIKSDHKQVNGAVGRVVQGLNIHQRIRTVEVPSLMGNHFACSIDELTPCKKPTANEIEAHRMKARAMSPRVKRERASQAEYERKINLPPKSVRQIEQAMRKIQKAIEAAERAFNQAELLIEDVLVGYIQS